MTKHRPPRIKKNFFGKCMFPANMQVDIVRASLPASTQQIILLDFQHMVEHGQVIWADAAHADCPTWEKAP